MEKSHSLGGDLSKGTSRLTGINYIDETVMKMELGNFLILFPAHEDVAYFCNRSSSDDKKTYYIFNTLSCACVEYF